MKAQTSWNDIPLERESYQLPQYVHYNLFPGIHIMARYDKIVIKKDISETILNI
jgi:hypothetical protein